MSCSAFIGHDDAKLALLLNAIDPRCGGVLFVGEKGCGKSTLARSLPSILPAGTPFIELPLNVTEDALLGTIAIEDTLKTGERVFQKGIFARAHSGVLFIDDVNLLSTEIVSLVLEVQSGGRTSWSAKVSQFAIPRHLFLSPACIQEKATFLPICSTASAYA